MRRWAMLALALAVESGTRPLNAQGPDTTNTPRGFWAGGMTLGVPGAGSQVVPQLFTMGASFVRIQHGLGADIAALTIPRALAGGLVPIAVRLGAGHGIGLGRDAFFVPTAGLVALGSIGPEAAFATGGLYGGGSVIMFAGPDTGVRVAYTAHYFDIKAMIWQVEIGVVGRWATRP